jgi:hypothetical protein
MKTPHHIAHINVFPKKGECVKTRWLIWQERPFPCIRAEGGALAWSNMEGLLGKYGSKPTGLGSRYKCHLLTPEGDIPEDYNRTHFAGFSHRPGPYGTPEVINPGTFALRGKDLGEITVKIGSDPQYPDIKVRGFDSPSASERDFIKAQIVPFLMEAINANAASLRKQALAYVSKRLTGELAEKSKELESLEKMIPQIMANA